MGRNDEASGKELAKPAEQSVRDRAGHTASAPRGAHISPLYVIICCCDHLLWLSPSSHSSYVQSQLRDK
jgi:hypothetical protein